MEEGNIHQALTPISWIIGKWKSTSAKGAYPTIQSFEYCEELEFKSVGQPTLNYTSTTWHPIKLNPMHLESGFLRIKPGTNKLAFMVSHNFGLTSLEEGEVYGNEIMLKAKEISRMSFAKDPAITSLERVIRLEDGKLHITVAMATDKTPLNNHLEIFYERI